MLAKVAGSNQFKIGQGDKTWNDLPFVDAVGATGPTGPTGPQGPSGATAAVATQSANGLMSAADKKKLDGIAAGAQVNVTQTSVTGNAGTATKLQTARTISLTGPVTGSATFDGSANASIATSIDFSTMPTDKFEAMLKSIWVPIKLTANKTFYVATTGSDTLSTGRGESASLPFKTIQACINYVTQNYNISTYFCTINIAAGTYTTSGSTITLPNFSYTTGNITLAGASTNSYSTVIIDPVTINGGNWIIQDLTIKGRASSSSAAAYTVLCNGAAVNILNVCIDLTGFTSSSGNVYPLEATNYGQFRIYATTSTSRSNGIYFNIGSYSIPALITLDNNASCAISADINIKSNITVKNQLVTVNNGSSLVITTSSYVNPGRKPAINLNGFTVTGKRYYVGPMSIINTGGAGTEFFPGTIAGTVANIASYS